jgi:hypothetical protein
MVAASDMTEIFLSLLKTLCEMDGSFWIDAQVPGRH